ncbi:mucin-4-like isoform X1 [Paramuricea clavata]|uniref:Mucin-4-like isoform X1 n=1 Tax=Paramuricea clavata TaxID=317549 RepID=A0A7D9DSZ6_PARCT|nr:mucin-4-like isoform X1 [Paramuricea clavata]
MYVPSSGGGSTVIRSATNAKLGYDATTRRLYVVEGISLFSMKLDGSDSQGMFEIGGGVKRFSVDDIYEKIYYIARATDYTNLRNFDGSNFTELLGRGNDDLTDIQVDSTMNLLFFAADESLERDLVVYNITSGGEARTLYNANSSSIRLTIDRLNQIIYWISYNTESNSLMLRKTDYNGNTTVITGSFAQSGRPAITQIGDYYYVLDSTQSIIRKYDKATDTVVQSITVYGGATEIIGANDLDECTQDPCDPLADCTNIIAGYSCVCQSGYTGNGSVCNDIDECIELDSNPCSNGSFCVNENGTYRCECNPGYNHNGTHCNDIEECENGHDCHVNATCTNTVGSYTCACNNGFSGNGTICEDLQCYIEWIYLATASEIYVIVHGSNIATLTMATNAKLEYDRLTKRMLYFTEDGNTLYTMKLDGSNKTVISTGIQMDAFTIDYTSRFIYYISQLDNDLKGFPLSDSSNISDLILNLGSVKDLDFDGMSR